MAAGGVVDVSSHYPLHVADDAAHHWRWFTERNHSPFRGRGELAAWTADECEISKCEQALATVHDLASRGRLDMNGHHAYHSSSADRYVDRLEHFLIATGYDR